MSDGDYISRQDAIKALTSRLDKKAKGEIGSFYNTIIQGDIECIESLPSTQPEIIHCRNCIHAIKDGLCGGYWCKGKAVTSNHYCGYAERRTDE